MKLCFYSTEKRENIDSSADSADSEKVVRVFAGFRGRVGDFGRKRQTFRKERNSRFRSQSSSPLNTSNDASQFVLAVFFISMKVEVTQLFYINEGLVVKIILYSMAIAPRGGGSSREGMAARQQTGGNRPAELDTYRFFVIRKIGLEPITVNIAE